MGGINQGVARTTEVTLGGTSASVDSTAVAATLLQNARLRDRVDRLYRVTSGLSNAVTLSEAADILLTTVAEACEAEVASLSLVAQDGAAPVLLTDHFVGLDAALVAPFRRVSLDAPIGAAHAVRSRTAVFIESQAEQELLFRTVASPTAYGGGARVALPLVYRDDVLGSLNLGFREWRAFDQEERTFLLALAAQCALSVVRARLYDENEGALQRAEAAVRARQDVMAVVSHDLRNPLAAVLATTAVLTRRDAVSPEMYRRDLERIQRNAMQMARLIDDLVDAGSMEEGRLKVDRRACSPSEVVVATSEMFVAPAAERQVELDAAAAEDSIICADRDRLIQALSNLVANAVKITPPGGVVRIRARRLGKDVRFIVQDTGPGIDEAELPHLFDRYWRGATTKYRGSGLGLAIAKGIVDAHGGRIWAVNEPTGGAAVSFTIPSAPEESAVGRLSRSGVLNSRQSHAGKGGDAPP